MEGIPHDILQLHGLLKDLIFFLKSHFWDGPAM